MTDVIGIIGGSGFYQIDGLSQVQELSVDTPFGKPSDVIVKGVLHGKTLLFLSRHGRGHRIPPSEINFRANLFALKQLGARWLISVSAVGSMKEKIKPGDFAFPDQFIDLTKKRAQSFFGDGIVAHVALADPVCPVLSQHLAQTAEKLGIRVHRGGTYVCIEGPQFSTRAESRLYRQWGVDVIGMTNMPEARLAREAEIAYATMALATDYDCWHEGEDDVSVTSILEIIRQNVANARKTVSEAVRTLEYAGPRTCDGALEHAILTDPAMIPAERKAALAPLIGKYFKEGGR